MHMYQGKWWWGSKAEVPTLTWLVLSYDYQNEVRSVHESIYPSLPNNYTTMVPLSTSHEKARHSTHAYLGKFYKYPFKLSNNQAKLSKHSITADTAIRIVLLTLQGCTTFTHMTISYHLCTRHHSRGVGEDVHHNTSPTAPF